mmetsp:Transcript_13879/g.55943  ORF Transcript_13879/g.55943 Transcript_13879/m.55943 type:complete len:307 (-) Transcript_13879:115-1035(-)
MGADWIPLDISSGLTKELPEDVKYRWGICGTGRCCHDFVQALKGLPNAVLACVSSRSREKAAEFAALHGIPESFGSFREMADQGDFDIMYVGTLHPFHREHAQAALEAGKHVLVEKPFVTSLDDALALTELAEKKGLFIAEGLWTRYFPAVEQALHMIRSGFLGEVKQVEADCCIDAAAVGDTSVLFNKELGGGAHFFFSIYTLGYATAVFGTEPEKILATGHVSDGIDFSNVVVLLYADGKTGIAISGMQVESTEETRILGSKGRITIRSPAHCPTSTAFCGKLEGRGNVEYEHESINPTHPGFV